MGIIPLDVRKKGPDRFAHGSGSLGTAAGNYWRTERFGKLCRQVLGDIDQRAYQPEIPGARPRNGRQRTDAARKHGIAEKRLAEIVGGVPESDHVRAKGAGNFVDGAPAITAAKVATMVRLLFEETDGGPVVEIGPVDASILEVLSQRFDGAQELALFDGEGAHRKVHRSSLLEQKQGLEQSKRVFPAR